MEPASPTNSTVSLTSGDTDWDFISDAEQTSTAPASLTDYDSDVERARHHAGDDVNGSLSDEDSGDDLGRDPDDDTVHAAVRRESDRRVNEALSNSLHSTLDPFREPLPSSISGSLSSSDSTALVLSFPDPLTPSEELRAAAARRDDSASPSLPPSPLLTADTTAIADVQDDDEAKVRPPVQETFPTSVRDEVDETPIGEFAPTELAAEREKPAVDEEIVVQHTNAADIQKIASYNRRKRVVNSRPRRRLSFPTSSRVFQASNVSHSWTTSMSVGVRSISKPKLIAVLVFSIVSILVVVLGSAIYKAGPYRKTAPATVEVSTTAAPSLIPPRTLNDGIVTPILDAPKAVITTSSAAMLLQTPGAGPSTGGTAGQRGPGSSTAPIRDAKEEVIVKPSLALSVHRPSGTTRQGGATPLSARNELCSRGSRKGKEKEVDVHYADVESQTDSDRPLLLDGPRIPLTLGYIIRGVKAVLNDHLSSESKGNKSKSITDLLSLSTIVNFEELLDEFILRIVSKTSSILQELSSAASVRAGSLVSTASEHIDSAKVTLARHGSLVRSGAKILARHVTEQHRMARKGFNAVRAKDFQAVVNAAKLQGHNVKKGCKVVEYGLRSAVVEGQKMLAGAFGGMEVVDAVEGEVE